MLKQIARRAGWTITDQAFSSLTNFALTIIIARAFSPDALGAFSIAYLVYVFLLQLCRALTSQPLVVRYSAADYESCREGAARAVGFTLVFGAVTGCATALAALGFAGLLQTTLLALAVMLPGLLVQDCWRFVFFAQGRPALAAVNDVAWACVQFPLLAYLLLHSGSSVSGCVLAWGGAGSAAAVLGVFQARLIPSVRGSASWLRQHFDLAYRYAAEFLVFRSALQMASFAIGLVAGLAALGSLRAAQVLVGPVSLLFLSAELVAVPEAVRLLNRSANRFRQAVRLLSVVLTIVALMWGAVLAILPDNAGLWLLHANWREASPLLIPVALATAATGAEIGPWTALRAFQAANASLRARLIIAPITLVAGVIGALIGASLGAAIGLAIATWIGAAIWWGEYNAQLKRRNQQCDESSPLLLRMDRTPADNR